MCLMVVKFAGAYSVRTRHSSSRKGHVHHPVETVLDGSVASHGRPKLFGWELQ